jgi:putative transposase
MARNKASISWRLPDELWEQLQGWIPDHENTHRFGGGRPRRPDRDCLDGIFYVLRTGCQWKALDATDLCPGSTAHDRYQEWVRDGVFLKFWQAGLLEYDFFVGIDWAWLSMDGSLGKAPLGGEKDRQEPHRPRQGWRQAQHPDRRCGRAGGGGHRRGQPQ